MGIGPLLLRVIWSLRFLPGFPLGKFRAQQQGIVKPDVREGSRGLSSHRLSTSYYTGKGFRWHELEFLVTSVVAYQVP